MTPAHLHEPPVRALEIVRPGMLTTVQDLGRWGYQNYGVPVAGPMDLFSHRLANRLLRNENSAATLEVTLLGPELVFRGGGWFAVTGARFSLLLDDEPVGMDTVWRARSGSRLRFGARGAGARAYLGVAGGLALPAVFGSRATHLVSGMGGMSGRPVATGDLLPVATPSDASEEGRDAPGLVLPNGGARVRIMLGPHSGHFDPAALAALCGSRYRITPQSNRMGYRLEGPPLGYAESGDIISDATAFGSIQVPSSGLPILLMADRGTTGGYPKIATVISADLSLAGQLAPGDWIEFTTCDRRSALIALKEQESALLAI